MRQVLFILLLALSACAKKNNPLKGDSKQELKKIISELKLEDVSYGYTKKYEDGKTSNYFKITLWDIDDSTDFLPYTRRLIHLFNDSDYELDKCDFVSFYFCKKYDYADLFKYYKIDPKDYSIIEEADN